MLRPQCRTWNEEQVVKWRKSPELDVERARHPERRYLPVVVGHVSRREQAEQLRTATRGLLSLDEKGVGAYRAHRDAIALGLAARQPNHTHLLIVEDDAVLLDGWAQRCENYAVENPFHYVGLYVGRGAPRWPQQACEFQHREGVRGRRYIDLRCKDEDDKLLARAAWGVAYLWPVSAGHPPVLNGMFPQPERTLTIELERAGLIKHAWPSVFDHDDELPSIASPRMNLVGRKVERRAWL